MAHEIKVIGTTRRDGSFHVSALQHLKGKDSQYNDWNTVVQLLRIRAVNEAVIMNARGFVYTFPFAFGDYRRFQPDCCFSAGYWINDRPWINELGWKN